MSTARTALRGSLADVEARVRYDGSRMRLSARLARLARVAVMMSLLSVCAARPVAFAGGHRSSQRSASRGRWVPRRIWVRRRIVPQPPQWLVRFEQAVKRAFLFAITWAGIYAACALSPTVLRSESRRGRKRRTRSNEAMAARCDRTTLQRDRRDGAGVWRTSPTFRCSPGSLLASSRPVH